MRRPIPAGPASRSVRRPLRMALLCAAAACSSPNDQAPPTPHADPTHRPRSLPPKFAAVADFCAVPRDEPAAPLPAGSRPARIGEADRVDLRDAPFPTALRCAVRTSAQMEQLWALVDPRGAPPAFPEEGMVVLAAAGTIGSEGHWIAIDTVWIRGDTVTVAVRERMTGDGCPAEQRVIFPAAAVRVAAAAVVRFREDVAAGEPCS